MRPAMIMLFVVLAGLAAVACRPPEGSSPPAVTITPARPVAVTTPESQDPELLIVPGQAVGPVKLGDSQEAVRALLGPPAQQVSASDERARWKSFGYDPSIEIPFVVGFDELWEYNGASLPIWKVYFGQGKVRLINVSAYIYSQPGDLALAPGVKLRSPREQALAALGPDGLFTYAQREYENVCYHTRGLDMVLENDVVMNFVVYPPMDAKKAETVQHRLRKAYASPEKEDP